jgi:hypothetical protein
LVNGRRSYWRECWLPGPAARQCSLLGKSVFDHPTMPTVERMAESWEAIPAAVRAGMVEMARLSRRS